MEEMRERNQEMREGQRLQRRNENSKDEETKRWTNEVIQSTGNRLKHSQRVWWRPKQAEEHDVGTKSGA